MTELPRLDDEYLRIAQGEIADDPGAQRAARLLSLASRMQAAPPLLDVDRAWADLEGRLTARRAIRWFEVVVGVAALLVITLVTYKTVAPVIAAHVDEHYEATATAPVTVRLPDGSRAMLTPLARVRYRASYFRPAREVTLEGEARFLVRPDSAHVFVVHAAAATLRTVGAVFSVRANPWERTVSVSVESGTVQADSALIINP